MHLWGTLVLVALTVLVWSLQFNYTRNSFRLVAIGTGAGILGSLGRLTTDDFKIVGSLAQVMVVVVALIICAKMKDPTFSNLDEIKKPL